MFKLFKFSFVPREKKFFALFEQSAQNAVQIAQQLRDMAYTWENVKERVEVITDLEHEGDAITHQIMAQLQTTFITPFDREDIALLANSLDNVTDFIESAADTMWLYKIEQPTETAKELSVIIVQTTAEIEKAILEMHDRLDRDQIIRHCMELNRLENVGDSIHRAAMAELFADSTDAAHLIKWRDIYEHMESAIDSCEDVANVLEGMALKYA